MSSREITPTDALRQAPQGDAELAELRRLRRQVAGAVGLVAVIVLAWSLLAPVAGAIIAPGVVKTERDRKQVRHQEGGIVREILVREGQQVKAGEALMLIGDVRTDALLSLQQDQWMAEAIRHARLGAEFALAGAFGLPEGVQDSEAAQRLLKREQVLFAARRKTLHEQEASLQAQVEATRQQARSLETQIAAIRQGAALAREELALNRDLVSGGFVQRTRVLALERAVADYDARIEEQASELALARQRLAELQLRVAQARNQYQQQAATELKDSTTRMREIEEQLRPARDMAERQVVRAPVDGEVMDLRVSTAGAVIGPREPLLDIVPRREALVVEARIEVGDIEHVHTGSEAEVRLSAYEYRAMPMIPGRVTAVSADRMVDERTGATWFAARVEVDPQSLAAYRDAEMRAGMPAEVYVQTGSRTLLDYLLRPILVSAGRGMREP